MVWQIDTQHYSELTPEDREAWLSIRAENPHLESPYHHPDYHALINSHQGNVKLVMARENGVLRGVLPWQGGRFARPSGMPMSDYQAVISRHADKLGGEDTLLKTMLQRSKIGAFHYSAMPSYAEEGPDRNETARNVISDPETWRAARDSSYRRHLKSNRRRIRKANEDIGEPRIVLQSRDIDAYKTLMGWKSEKFVETGKYDVLNNPGTAGLLRALWERGPKAELRADLHVLYFGDRMAACDLGLTDGHVFHSWIVGYDAALMSYGPGIQLLESVIDAVPQLGYGVIDLGPGLDGYKRHYASDPRRVSSGVVTFPGTAGYLAAAYDRAEQGLHSKSNDLLGKLRRRYSQIAACDASARGRVSAMMRAARAEMRKT